MPIKVIYCVQIVNFFNMVMLFSYPALSKYFRQKTALLIGQIGMVAALFSITLFNQLELNTLMIITMLLFLGFYEFGIGTIVFIHIFETNPDSITGLGSQWVFILGFTTMMITPTLIVKLTVSGFFVFYGSLSLLCLLYIAFFFKDTSRIEIDEQGNKKVV